jgi:hypothetical protein
MADGLATFLAKLDALDWRNFEGIWILGKGAELRAIE